MEDKKDEVRFSPPTLEDLTAALNEKIGDEAGSIIFNEFNHSFRHQYWPMYEHDYFSYLKLKETKFKEYIKKNFDVEVV